MEVTLDGKDHTFTSKGSGDDKKWYLDDEEAENAEDIVYALGAVSCTVERSLVVDLVEAVNEVIL